MCGIVGVFDQNDRSVDEITLQKMSAQIAHRGPDGEGVFQSGPMSLAHRRLSILDLTEKGSQPMHSHDGRWTIVFNGCIYNFKELRKELKAGGAHFHSDSDTEVIVEGIAQQGTDFLKRLNGMFALAAYDGQKKELVLSRDRYGQKPLYYWFNGSTLVFASEIKAIIAHPLFEVKMNPRALNEYFTSHFA